MSWFKRFSVTPYANTHYYYNCNYFHHQRNTSSRQQGWSPPPWSTPLTDPSNWEISIEWETVYDALGHITGHKQVQRAYYKPQQAQPEMLSQPSSSSRMLNGKMILILLLIALPALPVLVLLFLLSLGVFLTIVGQLIIPLILVVLSIAGVWRLLCRQRQKKQPIPKVSDNRSLTWHNQPTQPVPWENDLPHDQSPSTRIGQF